jgi:glycosyltransferase involved in cell wall biosynthesis
MLNKYEIKEDVGLDILRESKILFSVVMPTYNSNLLFLRYAIESVINQSYPNWELCIADDFSPNDEVRQLISKYALKDARIKYIFRETNGHISEATNSASSIASGEWVALLDHDDLLHPEALYWVVKAINRYPNTQLIYSDEDKVDTRGNRSGPYFKTEFNRQLFYSHNMICHFSVYRKSILDKIGGFRKGFEGPDWANRSRTCRGRSATS